MEKHEHPKLNQFFATAISGNDILSSALYVSGIAAIYAGIYAPVILIIIGVVLYLYKSVYTEVVEALPVNGGAYNCLLNGTSKTFAAVAGVMTILSYVATSVLSGKVGVEYLNTIFHVPVIPLTIALLFAFALLVISGLKDSAKVALGIFGMHIFVLTSFLVMGLLYYLNGHSNFMDNFKHTADIVTRQGGLIQTIYLAFSASLLGVSGFESSANFVEEQQKGVFRKTLRNMLIAVVIFNPLISLVTLNTMPINEIAASKDFLLADAAKILGGTWFQYLVVIDAFLVLWGAVLTSFVGVSGLIYRMSADACLPAFFTKMNSKGSFPRIIIAFFLLCSSILIITKGDLLSLAGVYTIAFLGVMSSFAFGNLILKETRTELKRTYHAPVVFVVLAFLATFFGIFGNIRLDVNNLRFFELYFIPTMVLVIGIIYQDYILRFALRATKNIPQVHNWLLKKFRDLADGKFLVFVHHPSRLYQILDYINRNETGWDITLVNCQSTENGNKYYDELKTLLPAMQKAGAFPHFQLHLVYKDRPFNEDMVEEMSKEFGIRKNRIFMGSIHHFHNFEYDELGGVRIIF